MHKKLFLISIVALSLGACAFAENRGTQELTVLTPGAQDSICFAYVDGLKYKYKPPQTRIINRSKEDLVVDCMAPGNRRRDVVIAARVNKEAKQNAFNLGVGAAWDIASKAAYSYPQTIEVDFTHMPIRPEALLPYNNPDIKQPEEYELEEFLPGTPRLNSDMQSTAQQSHPRREKPETPPSGKGELMDVIKQMF